MYVGNPVIMNCSMCTAIAGLILITINFANSTVVHKFGEIVEKEFLSTYPRKYKRIPTILDNINAPALKRRNVCFRVWGFNVKVDPATFYEYPIVSVNMMFESVNGKRIRPKQVAMISCSHSEGYFRESKTPNCLYLALKPTKENFARFFAEMCYDKTEVADRTQNGLDFVPEEELPHEPIIEPGTPPPAISFNDREYTLSHTDSGDTGILLTSWTPSAENTPSVRSDTNSPATYFSHPKIKFEKRRSGTQLRHDDSLASVGTLSSWPSPPTPSSTMLSSTPNSAVPSPTLNSTKQSPLLSGNSFGRESSLGTQYSDGESIANFVEHSGPLLRSQCSLDSTAFTDDYTTAAETATSISEQSTRRKPKPLRIVSQQSGIPNIVPEDQPGTVDVASDTAPASSATAATTGNLPAGRDRKVIRMSFEKDEDEDEEASQKDMDSPRGICNCCRSLFNKY